MQNVFSTFLGPILVLWLGALVFYVMDRFLEPQDAGVAETVVLALATGMLAWGHARVGTAFRFGRALVDAGWPGSAPFFLLERTSWVLALIVLGIATAASLASLGSRMRGRAGRTALLGTMLFLLSAGDWATLAFVWVLVDVFSVYAQEESCGETKERDLDTERRRRVAFLSLSGTVVLGLAVTVWRLSGGDLGAAAPPPWPVAILIIVAALLRLLPWPFLSWYDSGIAGNVLRHQTLLAKVVFYMTPVLSAVYLCVRMGTGLEIAERGRSLTVLSLWAGLGLLASAIRAWSAGEPRHLIDMAAPYGAALCLLAVGLGLPAQWLLWIGASAVLNVCALYLSWTQCQYLDLTDPRSYWRVAPTGIALLSLAGLPLTVGFPARAAIYSQVFAQGRWFLLLLLLLGEAGMLGALLRVLLDVECVIDQPSAQDKLEPDRRRAEPAKIESLLRNLAYGAGTAQALGIVILGMAPRLLGAQPLFSWLSLLRVYHWAALLLPAVGAIALYRSQETLTAWIEEWWPLMRRALDAQWILRAAERAAHLIAAAVWSASRVVEGAGYMAWVLLFCLVALLLLGTR